MTVIVLPEADEVEIAIDEERDLRIDVKRSSGPGGQSVNTTDSAVRITHLPTGLVVEIQDEKSQHKNKAKAMSVLRSRLYDLELQKQREADSATRRSMVGAGDRSDKVRTYNFPQDRVTDHRIGKSLHNLPAVMDGELDDLIDALADGRPGRPPGVADRERRGLTQEAAGRIDRDGNPPGRGDRPIAGVGLGERPTGCRIAARRRRRGRPDGRSSPTRTRPSERTPRLRIGRRSSVARQANRSRTSAGIKEFYGLAFRVDRRA